MIVPTMCSRFASGRQRAENHHMSLSPLHQPGRAPRRTRIKICGITDPATALVAAEAGADAIGLVFVRSSPRGITTDAAQQVASALPPFVEPVGLFVDESIDQIQAVIHAAGLRTVQLHGKESPPLVATLAPVRVIKALPFDPTRVAATMESWQAAPPNLAAILWDAPPQSTSPSAPGDPPVSPQGGSGCRIDWDALARAYRAMASPTPEMILAGGLTPQNVGRAIATVSPFGVDVSSGVESSRGVKDPARIRAFCRAVREADAEAG